MLGFALFFGVFARAQSALVPATPPSDEAAPTTAYPSPAPADDNGLSPADASAPKTYPAAETARPADLTAPRGVSDPGYLLQSDDVVEAVVFREPDLTTDGMVRKDGLFDMKLIGAVRVAGLSLDQAAETIRTALARDYLVNPKVTLGILEYAKRKVDVLGEVRSPGVFAFPPRGTLSLGDAVALAGGFMPTADSAHVAVKRRQNDRFVTLTVDASTGAGLFTLRPDDSVSIPLLPRRHFTVLGQVNRPGTYDMPEGRTIYLTDAIAVAGGYTRIADPGRVLLKRTDGSHETVLSLNAKAMANDPGTERVQIENDDTITITESMF